MVWGMNGILYAQPIADVISVVITVFMALHLHRELSMAEKQIMFGSSDWECLTFIEVEPV